MKLKFVRVSVLNTILFTLVLAVTATTLTACSTDDNSSTTNVDDTDYDAIEQDVFDQWMAIYQPDLLLNRQEEGYYIDILTDATDPIAPTTNKTSCWVRYNITSRDLEGNICNTRNQLLAVQQGTYTVFTHYMPTSRFVQSEYSIEYEDNEDYDSYYDNALDLTLRGEELILNGVSTKMALGVGSKFRLWMPSRLSGTANGSNGYAGQFSISGNRPMVSDIEITEVITNASPYERAIVDWFISNQSIPSNWTPAPCDKDDDDATSDDDDDDSTNEDDLYYYDDEVNASENVYYYVHIDYNYKPTTPITYLNPYNYDNLTNAANLYELDELINEALIERFDIGVNITGNKQDKVGDSSKCTVWYITRDIDGFIIDTNIAEVKDILYDLPEGTSEDTELTYTGTSDKDSYIDAWYYTIPDLEYGQWAMMITSSDGAYSSSGVGSSSTGSEVNPYSPLVFQIFIEEDDDF